MASKCGAKTRAGGRCQQAGNPKNGRCRYHGGLSTGPSKGSQNALTHGIYAQHMTEDERVAYAALPLGNVDDELRMQRIQLARALAAQAAAKGKPELDEVTTHSVIGPGSRKDIIKKVRDYTAIIDRITGRIESLEKTRLLLRIELGLTDDDMDANALTPGTPDEAAPANPIR